MRLGSKLYDKRTEEIGSFNNFFFGLGIIIYGMLKYLEEWTGNMLRSARFFLSPYLEQQTWSIRNP